jgi:tetratricopeptide (TPR) repeat protein
VGVWKAVEKIAKQQYEEHPHDMQKLFDWAEIQYGLLNACVANENKEVFDRYIEVTEKNIDTLLRYNSRWAAVHALKAGILSTEMAFSPSKGVFLGPRSNEHIEKALKLDKTEPSGWVQQAGAKLHTPKMFGGSLDKALESYEKAISLYEQDSSQCHHNWQYINTKAWLGIAYVKDEQYSKALQTFKSVLAFEPDFGWVKHNLLPNLEKKMNP